MFRTKTMIARVRPRGHTAYVRSAENAVRKVFKLQDVELDKLCHGHTGGNDDGNLGKDEVDDIICFTPGKSRSGVIDRELPREVKRTYVYHASLYNK